MIIIYILHVSSCTSKIFPKNFSIIQNQFPYAKPRHLYTHIALTDPLARTHVLVVQ